MIGDETKRKEYDAFGMAGQGGQATGGFSGGGQYTGILCLTHFLLSWIVFSF